MYNCQKCGKSIGPGVRQHKVVTKTRPKKYRFETKTKGIRNSEGWEIVVEIGVCPDCAKTYTSEGGR